MTPFLDGFRVADNSGFKQTRTCSSYQHTGGRAKLEQSKMIWILGLQRAHQNLKRRKRA